MQFADVADIVARFRPLDEQETVNAEAFLEDAWWMLLSRLPSLEDQINDGHVRLENVTRVICQMVIRILKNPDGLLEESIDDYRFRRDALLSTGALHVTAAELADLTPATVGRRNSVRLVVYGDR
jgi:hypothetical protein